MEHLSNGINKNNFIYTVNEIKENLIKKAIKKRNLFLKSENFETVNFILKELRGIKSKINNTITSGSSGRIGGGSSGNSNSSGIDISGSSGIGNSDSSNSGIGSSGSNGNSGIGNSGSSGVSDKTAASCAIDFLIDLFSTAIERQVLLDFFYFYDLFYRQGNYNFYLKMCYEVVLEIKKFQIDVFEDLENCFIFYNKMNVQNIKVKNRIELEEMIKFLKIFYEIVGPEFEIQIEFFNEVLLNKASSREGKILQRKIS